jgi:hypothetical protein
VQIEGMLIAVGGVDKSVTFHSTSATTPDEPPQRLAVVGPLAAPVLCMDFSPDDCSSTARLLLGLMDGSHAVLDLAFEDGRLRHPDVVHTAKVEINVVV